MRCATYLRPSAGVVDEDFISGRRFAIFDESDRGITLTVFTRAAAIAALLLAAACGGEPEVLEPDPTTAGTTDVSPTAPRLPEQAREESDEGAAAFAAYWVDLFNYASRTGDVAELREFSSSCRPCAEFAQSSEELADGERPTEDVWTIETTTVSRDQTTSDVRFGLTLLGGETSTVAFELTPRPPYRITDLYRVEQ